MDVREGTVQYAMQHRKPLLLLDTVVCYMRAGGKVDQFRVVASSGVNDIFSAWIFCSCHLLQWRGRTKSIQTLCAWRYPLTLL